MRINHNIAALNTYNKLGVSNNAMSKNMEKLSSGLRINRAADDAAGLSISEKMRAQIRGLDQASKNTQDGISLLQTAEGGLNETHDILQRMNELATQAANGTLQDEDRKSIDEEMKQLGQDINRIAESTNFNGKSLLDGTLGVQTTTGTTLTAGTTPGLTSLDISGAKADTTYSLSYDTDKYVLADNKGNQQSITFDETGKGTLDFDKMGVSFTLDGTQTAGVAGDIVTGSSKALTLQIGSDNESSQQLGIQINKMDTEALGINNISVSTTTGAQSAMDSIKDAIKSVSAERSKMGAYQNRLEHTMNNLNTTSENLTSAESRIRDVDMAKEMMEQTKNSILAQASQAMLTQANQQPQNVLQMLR
ncbi:flagellin [Priestia endophytica]|uniref:flagellin N-terminal helical domain-containing protein n=1 Tax=Priestia endophytica TaxID=135735 RepID=UPI000DCA4994|nr:flagellin [Priestia endophytica]RAS79924.1 flagellin [Priestia endophytica]